MKKTLIVTFIAGAILGGIASALSVMWFDHQKRIQKTANDFEIHSLARDAPYWAIKINQQTGETWGLTLQGRWFKIQEFKIADPMEWLKDQGYAPDKSGKWEVTNNSNSN